MAAYAALVFFKTSYSTFLHYYDAALPSEVLNMCEGALKELKWLQDFVERLDSRSRSGKRMSAWLQRIPEALAESREMLLDASDIDELIESSRTVLETLKKIQEELVEVEEEEAVSLPSSSSSKMIGLGDERSKLKAALVDCYTEGEPVFLVHGMAGIGKTMLAREIYEDLDISEWFECRAWVTAGNEWTPQQVTEAILSQLDPEKLMREDEKVMLKECLDLKRWLIVVDDVWDYDIILDCTKTLLPTDIEGSRLLFTSRTKHSNFDGYLLEKRLLNKEESWDLLRHKVFAGGSCPPQLEHSGKKIAEKCDGLPLTIITVADLLSNAEESLWIDVAEKKRHRVFIDAYDQISEVVPPVASFPAFPYELVKLSLNGLGYPWEKMRLIASLDSLRVLELECNAFQGPIWEVEELDFMELRSLLIEGLDLVKLKAGPGSFSNLNHVSIKHCYKFEEIQLENFENVSRLEVVDSNPLVEKSVKQIMLENKDLPKHFSVHCSWKSA